MEDRDDVFRGEARGLDAAWRSVVSPVSHVRVVNATVVKRIVPKSRKDARVEIGAWSTAEWRRIPISS